MSTSSAIIQISCCIFPLKHSKAPSTNGNVVKRFNKKETLSEIFFARNFNNFDRYIRLIKVRGRRRSALIMLELIFNSGWTLIAEKMRNFMPNKRRRPAETTTV
uniref:Uncharacterized protein n=1 Tax=Solanum lycopersicum TaxID=4081 RepID=A0A3Q7IGX9_SOLLC